MLPITEPVVGFGDPGHSSENDLLKDLGEGAHNRNRAKIAWNGVVIFIGLGDHFHFCVSPVGGKKRAQEGIIHGGQEHGLINWDERHNSSAEIPSGPGEAEGLRLAIASANSTSEIGGKS